MYMRCGRHEKCSYCSFVSLGVRVTQCNTSDATADYDVSSQY